MAEWNVPGFTELKTLGSGGFGEVVLARHHGSGTLVAIKYLRQNLLSDAEFTELRLEISGHFANDRVLGLPRGEIDLTADLLAPFQQHNRVSPHGGDLGDFQTGRTAADDSHSQRPRRRNQSSFVEFALASSARVVNAADPLFLRGLVRACVVAGDA